LENCFSGYSFPNLPKVEIVYFGQWNFQGMRNFRRV